jgi:type II secretory pathway component PulF
MPRYLCELVEADGRVATVLREAASEAEAAALFARGGRFLVSIEEDGMARHGRSRAARRRSESARLRSGAKVEELRELTVMLGALLESGLSLKEALAVAAEPGARQGSGSGVSRLAGALLEAVEKGASLSEAIADCGGFSEFYRGMIAVGERIGSTERVLPRLAAYMTESKAIRDKLAGALVYPALVCACAVLGAGAILVFLIPRLLELFDDLGGKAAVQARASAAAMARASYSFAGATLALAAAALIVAALRRRDESFAARLDALALRLPLAGKAIAARETLGFAYAMEVLAGGGLPVEAALGAAAGVVGNRAFRAAILRCRDEALKGQSLSAATARRPELPPRIARWLAIGEKSGQVELVFGQLRRFYQGEVERASSRLAALAEPALIVLVGFLILAMVQAFVVPLFSMYGGML